MGITIYMVGDSTMADKDEPQLNPEHGWGQLLPEFIDDSATVDNHAANGRSTLSFIEEGRWAAVEEKLQPGDWLIVQFGHNDEKRDQAHLFTDPKTTYPANLTRFVETAKAKGAQPILATSIYRRKFDEAGNVVDTHGDYPEALGAVARETATPLIDLHTLTGKLLQRYGNAPSKALFLHFAPGEHPYYPDGKADNTHLSRLGAREVAQLFADDVRRQGLAFPLCAADV